ncbi:MAG: hypothetical protein PHX34_04765 [Candidatus Shapirobacteria bacterium]|nr:hypothetical protein [Candidatus Shapirobacteria bacterium]
MSNKQKIIFWLIFISCFFIQVLPVIRSGLNYSYGLGFWGSNGHDAIWHLSLINHIKNPFKIDLPIFAGVTLQNYHPFFDILIAFFAYVSHISSTIWYFQIFPIISTIIFLVSSFFLGRRLTSNFFGGLLLMFFNAFANSFGWVVSLIKSGQISGESLFWAMQSASNQLNPPFVLSLIFINCLLLLILNKKINQKLKLGLIFFILVFTPITKAYGGVVVYLIFGLYSLLSFKINKKSLVLLLISLPFSYLIFRLYNPLSISLFLFQPFWFTNSLIEAPDRFFLPKIVSMRYSLENTGIIGLRLIVIYLFSTIIFYLGNFSWRILGFFSFRNFKNKLKWPLIITILLISLIPLFFVQKGTAWNTIQFLYYSLFLSNIFLVIFLLKLKSSFLKKIIFIFIIITTLVSNWETVKRYLSNPAPATLPTSEIEALNKLKNLPDGVVLTFPYDKYQKKSMSTPISLYAYETTAYVSAFSGKNTFLEDQMNLDITGFNWQDRRSEEELFFNSLDKFFARGFLLNNNIDYIYLVDNQSFKLDPNDLQINLIFDNSSVKIYQVRK